MQDAEAIKDRIDIADLIGSYLQLKKAGSNYKALCPFHSEKTPSFMINPERQIYKCFGCNEGGDAFEFIMKMENLTFPEALSVLAQKVGYQLTERSSSYKRDPQEDKKSILYQINQFSADAFHKILLEHPSAEKAREYLKKRRLTDKTISKYLIGYAPVGSISSLLGKKGFKSDDIRLAGSPDRFKNRIVFPIFDAIGNIVGFTARALSSEMMPKYLNTPETPIFVKGKILYGLHQGKQKIKEKDYAVLVEGQMDVVLASQCGVENTVASSGTALTNDHLKTIKRYTSNLILSFDMDEAGQKTTLSSVEIAQGYDFNLKVAVLPEPYKDAGEAIEAGCRVFTNTLKESPYVLDWIYQNALKKYAIDKNAISVLEKKKIAREVLPFLTAVEDPIERSHWIDKVSRNLGVSQDSVLQAIKKINERKSGRKMYNTDEKANKDQTKSKSTNELLYGLIGLSGEQKAKYSALYNELDKEYASDKKELLFYAEQYVKSASVLDVASEIEQIIDKLKLQEKDLLKSEYAKKIAEAEKNKDIKGVKKLLEELQEKVS